MSLEAEKLIERRNGSGERTRQGKNYWTGSWLRIRAKFSRAGSPKADLIRYRKGGETMQKWRKRKAVFDLALIE